jgi:hypothetical protein
MILYRLLLGFDLLFAAIWLTLLGVGVVNVDVRPTTSFLLLGLMALPFPFIVGGMRLAARERYGLANVALGSVASFGSAAIFLLWWSLATSTDL